MKNSKPAGDTQPTVWAQAADDMSVLGADMQRLGAASVVCISLNTTLLVRTSVVTLETANAGSRIALDAMPATLEETTDFVASLFETKDDTGDTPPVENKAA